MSPKLHVWIVAMIVLALWLVTPASGEAQPLSQSLPGGTVPCLFLPLIHTAPREPRWEWELPRPQGNSLGDVWGSGPDDVFAVGAGTILHYDGTTWTNMASNSKMGGGAVWGSGPNDVYAVGPNVILRSGDAR